MSKDSLLIDALDRRVVRRQGRRDFFMKSATLAVGAAAGGVLTACGDNGSKANGATDTPTASEQQQDIDVLNFALNLEYLEANFYSWAVLGKGIDGSLQTGTGTQGAVTGGAQVDFSSDPFVQATPRKSPATINHVAFLRTALGKMAVAQPAINIDGTSATGAFSMAAAAAGVIPMGQTFNPYSSPNNFLLGAFIFEDVGVTAYKGGSVLITNKTYLEAAAGILAAEAYHAGLVRTALYAKGLSAPVGMISDARDSLDGTSDDDQGIIGQVSATRSKTLNAAVSAAPGTTSNIVPLDSNGIAFSRSTGQVLNIVYLNHAAVSSGGFFPAGLNGNLSRRNIRFPRPSSYIGRSNRRGLVWLTHAAPIS
jgi:hypothetical protein